MKTLNVKNSIALVLTAASFFMMTSCQAPAERDAKVNPKVAGDLVEVKSINEVISGKSVYVKGSKKDALATLDSGIKQIKMDGSKVEAILAKISNEDKKDAIEAQLNSGAIAILVLRDEVKILKVTPEVDLTLNYDILSSKYLSKMKELHKASDVAQQSSKLRELRDLKYISPRAQEEKFGLVQMASVKVVKFGVLDNVYSDYNEKKAILDIKETPFEMATHIVLGDENE